MWAQRVSTARWLIIGCALALSASPSLGSNPLRAGVEPNEADTHEIGQPSITNEVPPLLNDPQPVDRAEQNQQSRPPDALPDVPQPKSAEQSQNANTSNLTTAENGAIGQPVESADVHYSQGVSYYNLGQEQLHACSPAPEVFRLAEADCALNRWPGRNENFATPADDAPPCADDFWTSNWVGDYITFGAEATFLHSHFAGSSLTTDNAGLASSNSGAFEQMTYAPRVWLAYQRPEWGLVGRFWYLSDGDGDFAPLTLGGTSSGLNASNRLKMYVADVEANRQWIWFDRMVVDTSVGVRFASLSSDGILSSVSVNGVNVYDAFAATSTRFNGTGVTTGLSMRLPIACNSWLCRGCTFNLFGNLRGSAIFGPTNSNASTANRFVTTGSIGSDADSDSASQDSTLFIGETQFGVEWDRQLRCLPAGAFFRIAGEYQFWGIDPSASSQAGTSLSGGGSTTTANARAGGIDLSLFGVSAAAGFVW